MDWQGAGVERPEGTEDRGVEGLYKDKAEGIRFLSYICNLILLILRVGEMVVDNYANTYSMRIVIQRVTGASVTVDGELVSKIGHGLMVLVGVEVDDTPEDAKWLAAKTAAMRIFNDENGTMNRSVIDVS